MDGRRFVSVIVVLAGGAAGAAAQKATSPDLGEVDARTSCAPSVTDRFDRALALLHHMTYPAARAEFAAIAAADPTCAMAHWGVAMTLFQPLWPTRPGPDDLRRGWEEVGKAQTTGAPTERERLFIDAAAAFFDPAAPDYRSRIQQWAGATRTLYERFSGDVEASAFYALALLAAAPPEGDPRANAEAGAILETILREHPRHPGALHYTIHANDAAGREHEATDVVHGYAHVAPRNPHALHMPTHIFVRLGEWADVVHGNEQAADAALETRAGDAKQWTWDEYPHAVEYEVYALLQMGDDSAALAALHRLQETPDLEPTFKTAFHLASIPARFALERRDWAAAAALEPRPDARLDWSRFPWPEAVTWFARGVGAARMGDAGQARTAEARLGELRDASRRDGEDLFARQTEILRLGVQGWSMHVTGDDAAAAQRLREAVELERTTPKHAVTPAPTLPAGELLGDLLLETGDARGALAAYEAVLAAYPNRLNALVGAARAAHAVGDDERAAVHFGKVQSQVVSGSARPERAEAAAFLRERSRH